MNKATKETAQWLAKRFGIPEESIEWFHSGICYDRVCVNTKDAADKVTAVACKSAANGGYYHGMPLGGQTEIRKPDGIVYYDITC